MGARKETVSQATQLEDLARRTIDHFRSVKVNRSGFGPNDIGSSALEIVSRENPDLTLLKAQSVITEEQQRLSKEFSDQYNDDKDLIYAACLVVWETYKIDPTLQTA